MRRIDRVVVSCEHATNKVPRRYQFLFNGKRRLLASHRGWDPGSLELGRRLAARCSAPIVASRATRLLADCNRSASNPRVFSEIARQLDANERELILKTYYHPHRKQIESLVERRLRAGDWVLHLSVHTFTPVLKGVTRKCDIGLLFDPERRWEAEIANAWRRSLRQTDDTLRVWLNYPYRGWTDGLTTTFRKKFGVHRYAGVELEVNQKIVRGAPERWRRVQTALEKSLSEVVCGLLERPTRG